MHCSAKQFFVCLKVRFYLSRNIYYLYVCSLNYYSQYLTKQYCCCWWCSDGIFTPSNGITVQLWFPASGVLSVRW